MTSQTKARLACLLVVVAASLGWLVQGSSRSIRWPDGGRGKIHMMSEQPVLILVEGLYTREMAEHIQRRALETSLFQSKTDVNESLHNEHLTKIFTMAAGVHEPHDSMSQEEARMLIEGLRSAPPEHSVYHLEISRALRQGLPGMDILIDQFTALCSGKGASFEQVKEFIDVAMQRNVGAFQGRMSDQTWLDGLYQDDPLLLAAHRRVQHLVQLDGTWQWQIARYPKGGFYVPHDDQNNRWLTVLAYLETADAGGETWFALNASQRQVNRVAGNFLSGCPSDVGLKVKPVQGSAALFYNYNLKPDVQYKYNSSSECTFHVDPCLAAQNTHAACPAGPGGKWISTHWLVGTDLVYHTPAELFASLAPSSTEL